MLQTAMEEISSLKRSVESLGLSIHNASATGKAALKGTWDELTGRLLSLLVEISKPYGFLSNVSGAVHGRWGLYVRRPSEMVEYYRQAPLDGKLDTTDLKPEAKREQKKLK